MREQLCAVPVHSQVTTVVIQVMEKVNVGPVLVLPRPSLSQPLRERVELSLRGAEIVAVLLPSTTDGRRFRYGRKCRHERH